MTKALFIGQAPPKVIVPLPFGRTHLYKWLASVGISQEVALRDFAFTALVDTFPGLQGKSHRAPNEEEISAGRPRLEAMIIALKPAVIVPVGILSIREILQDPTCTLATTIGQRFMLRPYGLSTLPETVIIPIPHPSGASTWQYMDGNKQLLQQALTLLTHEVKRA